MTQVEPPVQPPPAAPVAPSSPVQPAPTPVPASAVQSQDYVKAEEFRKFLEVEILGIIRDLVLKQEITQEIVQAIAKQTLEMITPGMSLEELYQNAVKMDDKFSQLAPLIVKIMQEYEEKYEKKALAEVSKLIKKGDYNAAQDMVKKVLQFKAFS